MGQRFMKNLYPKVFLPLNKSVPVFLISGADIVARHFSSPIVKVKITNWRIPNITGADQLLNTDGDTLLNTDGSTLFNTGA